MNENLGEGRLEYKKQRIGEGLKFAVSSFLEFPEKAAKAGMRGIDLLRKLVTGESK